MKNQQGPYLIKSIRELHQFWGLPKPRNPLVSVFQLEDTVPTHTLPEIHMFDFYAISIKKNFEGSMKYGQKYYDFDSGVMSFVSPYQVMSHQQGDSSPKEGISLVFHPDFLAGFTLARLIRNCGFFSYQLSEALHLSDEEEQIVGTIQKNIETEYKSNIDNYSQKVIIAQIELLLQYADRFYNRQFITRKVANDDILVRLEEILSGYFNTDAPLQNGLLTVHYISDQLNISTNYLSDMLRSITGQSTQQHIHNKLIDKAKELLTTTNLSAREIAYQLGFEYPQSFNKLFKKKTDLSPLEFRQTFN
ncbi:Helix-turn-helix domain-containing protein [Pedobacter westerhofensis]|uniref:Helix-turn-helix domain-containing protein n=1 Tax=Pedobacter westerhofensis TaxID=425512 RepID=A0A521BPQ5_9SPHI|nr:helix-turn-helix transcriptional regulator [Pedobacter westerhofensis]SMO49113.1 Helix-turn-helix domain-containing protein [Pedobacter westerhofensis]